MAKSYIKNCPESVLPKLFYFFITFFAFIIGDLYANSTLNQSAAQVFIKSTQSDYSVGDIFYLVVEFQLEKDWYIKEKPSKTIEFEGQGNNQLTLQLPEFPKSENLFYKTHFQTKGYSNRFFVKVPVYVQNSNNTGQNKSLTINVKWVGCHNKLGCKLEKKTLTLDFPIQDKQLITTESSFIKANSYSLIWLAFISFLGGLILNLMPCVLPVLSIKVLSLVNHKHTKHEVRMHSVGFLLGIILTFMALALCLLLLKSYGYSIGWGFQMQSMAFVYLLACFFLIFSLNLFGVFEFQMLTFIKLANHDQRINYAFLQAMMNGLLSVLVATPCSAPFMGAAIAYALQQSWIEVITTFICMGVGLAAPVLVLMNSPRFIKYIPKPGEWMLTLKQLFGFAMLLTAFWLLWVLMGLTQNDDIFEMLLSFIAISFGFWVIGKYPYKRLARYFGYGVVGASILMATYALYTKPPLVQWLPYSKSLVSSIHEKGQPVFVDFTARWCITCQVNKKLVLENEDVINALKKHNVALIRADWTHYEPIITEALAAYGASSIPLYVYYPKGKQSKPIILNAFLIKDNLLGLLSDFSRSESTSDVH